MAAACPSCDKLGLNSHFTYSPVVKTHVEAAALCERDPSQCAPSVPVELEMGEGLYQRLVFVNNLVNVFVKQEVDEKVYGRKDHWSLPDPANPRGDCEDFVLLKRKLLIEQGLPAGALQLVIVYNKALEQHHAVLAVNTDRGYYLLDNLKDDVSTIFAPGYVFIRIQAPENPAKFRDINGARM